MTTSSLTPHRPVRGRRLAAVATALGLLLAVGTAVAPASAHDELISSTPAAGDALDPAPAEITLTFSDNILEVGVEVSVTDAAGTQYVDGDPVVDGPTVTAGLASDVPGGTYQADWRVVSSDGHPISGTIPFTVTTPTEAETSTPTPAASEPPVATPSDEETATPATPSDDANDEASADAGLSGGQIALIAAIALAVLVVLAALLIILSRRRGRSDDGNVENPARGDDV